MASRRRKLIESKRAQKKAQQGKPGQQSRYARKKAFLMKNGGFGFNWPNKPWK